MDLNRLMIFKEVVIAGSFSKAASKLRQPKSRISRNISALESELGVQLIYRTTRQFQLSPEGIDLMERAIPLLQSLEGVVQRVTGDAEEVAGLLRVSVPEDIGVALMGDICHHFLQQHPRALIDLHVSNHVVDLVRDNFDLAIRIGRFKDSTHRQRKIGQIILSPYIAPTLLQRHGGRIMVEDIENIPCLIFSSLNGGSMTLRMSRGKESRNVKLKPAFSSSNLFVLKTMAIYGHGFAFLPPFIVQDALHARRLIPVLNEWRMDGSQVQVVTPQQKEMPLRVKAFINHLQQSLAASF